MTTNYCQHSMIKYTPTYDYIFISHDATSVVSR